MLAKPKFSQQFVFLFSFFFNYLFGFLSHTVGNMTVPGEFAHSSSLIVQKQRKFSQNLFDTPVTGVNNQSCSMPPVHPRDNYSQQK